ncbi:MAG: MDR family MFS transporter [Corynebacterium sp.]|uniref:MDR family MFS transporter n=1 Tax=Corynebacterium sp. TaxID=1720 RepID=UPI0026DB0162|nr:MDR family MFS transporter [Corynebacterium sp.]MDO4761348.1 MDR family MFS transporter [Corynebacterium sp.]
MSDDATDTRPLSPSAPIRSVGVIIAALMLSTFMSSLGQMVFATALPTIVGELGGINHMSWVITAFLLGQTISLPIFGKLGDLLDRKPLFIGANALFVLGSVLGACATNMGVLIAARALQGIAGGAMMILSQAITAEITTPRTRGKYMGIMGAVFGVSSVLGPVLGGWFTDGPGWRWGMWLNLPLGLIAIGAIMYFLHLPRKEQKFSLDWMGTATMAIATTALVLVVTWGGHEYDWSDPIILGLIAVSVAFTALLIVVELRVADPLIPLSMFRYRNFTLTTLAGIAVGVLMFGSMAYLPTYIQMVHHMSPTNAGLMMIPMMLGMIVTSIVVGNVVTRTGKYKIFPIVGQIIMAGAFFLLGSLTPETSLTVFGLYLAILGMGLGMSMQILVLIVQNTFPLAQVGVATGANNFFRQVAGTVGSALVGSMFISHLHDKLAVNVPQALAQIGDPALAQQLGGGNSLTPGMVDSLPELLQNAIGLSYNDALTPVFVMLAPLSLVAMFVLLFVKENTLRETA